MIEAKCTNCIHCDIAFYRDDKLFVRSNGNSNRTDVPLLEIVMCVCTDQLFKR